MTFDEWMRRQTGGKHCDTDDSTQTLLRKCWDAAAATTRQSLIEVMGSMLHCPCCGKTMDCEDSCTFAVDCPAEAENLAALRDAVRA